MPAKVCGGKVLAEEAVAWKLRTTSLQDTVVRQDPCCTLCLVRPLKSSWGGRVVTAVGQAEREHRGRVGSQGCVPSGSWPDVEAVDEKEAHVQSEAVPHW